MVSSFAPCCCAIARVVSREPESTMISSSPAARPNLWMTASSVFAELKVRIRTEMASFIRQQCAGYCRENIFDGQFFHALDVVRAAAHPMQPRIPVMGEGAIELLKDRHRKTRIRKNKARVSGPEQRHSGCANCAGHVKGPTVNAE